MRHDFKEFDTWEFSYKEKKLGSWSYCIDVFNVEKMTAVDVDI